MSNPFFVFTRSELLYLTAIFLLGLITGAFMLTIYISQTVDRLILEKNELQNQVSEQAEQIAQLEKNLKTRRQQFVKKTLIELETDANQHNQQKIKETIQKLLAGLMGKEIKTIDPLLLREIIHNRYIKVEDKTYRLQLLYLVLQEELALYIRVLGSDNLDKNE